MKMKKYKIIAIFVFAVIISAVFISAACAQQRDIGQLESTESTSRSYYGGVLERPQVQYDAENYKDPFSGGIETPAETTEALPGEQVEMPELIVQGIIWGGKITQAIINSTVVKTGDTIGGVRIVAIDKDGVTVFFQSRQIKIPAPAVGAPGVNKP